MRLLHVSKNRHHQHAVIANAGGLQVDGTSAIENSRSFASRNGALLGLICISLIGVVYAYAALSNYSATSKSASLRNASIQLPGAGTGQTMNDNSTPGQASTINVAANDSQNNGSGNPAAGSSANVDVKGVSENGISTSVSVNGQTVSTPANGSVVQTSINPNQTTSVDISNSHSNVGTSTGFNSTNQDLSVHSFSNSFVQEVE